MSFFCRVPCPLVTRINFSVMLKNSLSPQQANILIGRIKNWMDDGKIRFLGRWKSDVVKSNIRPVNSCKKTPSQSLLLYYAVSRVNVFLCRYWCVASKGYMFIPPVIVLYVIIFNALNIYLFHCRFSYVNGN